MQFDKIFFESYQRILLANSSQFFDEFYNEFINSSPVVKAKFSHTNFETQKEMLKQSLFQLKRFATTHESFERLKKTARVHDKDHHDIGSELYDLWLECLIKCVKKMDPKFTPEIELGWRVTLSPLITLMTFLHGNTELSMPHGSSSADKTG